MERNRIYRESTSRIIQNKNRGTVCFADNRFNTNYLNDITVQRIEEEDEDLLQSKFEFPIQKLSVEDTIHGKFDKPIQKKNKTGMPDNLKAGIESLSGFSMDDVRVHYNSSKPATVQALAYTQGTDIHVATGQEEHLPHEVWHVNQQMAGRVSPTTNINGMTVNDNVALEHEADVMKEKAVQRKNGKYDNSLIYKRKNNSLASIQMVREKEFKENPETFMKENVVLCDYVLGLMTAYGMTTSMSEAFVKLMGMGFISDHFFVLTEYGENIYILTPAIEKYDLNGYMHLFTQHLESCRMEIDSCQRIIEQCEDEQQKMEIKERIIKLKNEYKLNKLDFEQLRQLYLIKFDVKNDEYIEANYVPYKTGTPKSPENDVGHSKIKTDGPSDFVFTGEMQGCALVTTKETDDDETSFTLWHYQSPNSSGNLPFSSKFKDSKVIVDWFGDDEYLSGSEEPVVNGPCIPNTVATNFLWRKDGQSWKIISQENHVFKNQEKKIIKIKTFPTKVRDLPLSVS